MARFDKLAVSLLALLGVNSAFESRADTAPGLLATQFVTDLERIRRGASEAGGMVQPLRFCAGLISRMFDISKMSNDASAGAAARMSDEQKIRYRQAFIRRATNECAVRSHGLLSSPILAGPFRRTSDGHLLVTTVTDAAVSSEQTAVWRLETAGANYKVVDILWNGRSAVLTAQSEAMAVLSAGSDDPEAVVRFFERR